MALRRMAALWKARLLMGLIGGRGQSQCTTTQVCAVIAATARCCASAHLRPYSRPFLSRPAHHSVPAKPCQWSARLFCAPGKESRFSCRGIESSAPHEGHRSCWGRTPCSDTSKCLHRHGIDTAHWACLFENNSTTMTAAERPGQANAMSEHLGF